MPTTIKDIARIAKTSPSAVSFVLNDKAEGLVSESVRKRIAKAIRDTGYRRDRAAAGLRLNRTFKITLCVPARLRRVPLLGNMSHHELVNLLAHRLHEAGYGVVLLEIGQMTQAITERLSNEPMDGYMPVQFARTALVRLVRVLHETDRPVVAVDAPMEGRFEEPWQFGIDRERSFERATQYLIERGRRRIAVLDISIPGTLTSTKFRGYERAMLSAGLDPLPLYEMSEPDMHGLQQAVDRLRREQPDLDGVVLTDNYLAPFAQQLMSDRNVELIGFGDDWPARFCNPMLAYLRLPIAELVDLAVRSLLERIEGVETATRGEALMCDLIEDNP